MQSQSKGKNERKGTRFWFEGMDRDENRGRVRNRGIGRGTRSERSTLRTGAQKSDKE